jgi:hypothetical protein
MSDTLEIPLKDLRKWLDEGTVSLVEPLKVEGKNSLNNVKQKLDGVVESCDKLSENAEKEMAKDERRMNRRAKTIYKLANKFSEMIAQIVIPDRISSESLHLFSEDVESVLETIRRERNRWFPMISPYFIIDRRRFDVALKRTMDQFEEFRSFLSNKYAEAETVEDTFSMIEELQKSLNKLNETKTRKNKTELRESALEKKLTKSQQKITSIQSTTEVIELAQTNKEIEELNEKVKHNLRYLQKPFLKFQSLVLSGGYSLPLDETNTLGEYLSNPFEALAAEDNGYPVLKKILQRIEEVFAQRKMKLKSSRLRKADKQIVSILKDSLAPLQQNCKEALAKKRRLSTSGAIADSQSEVKKLQEILKDLRRQKRIVDSRIALLDKEIKEARRMIEDQKRNLEKTVLQLTEKNVQVTF